MAGAAALAGMLALLSLLLLVLRRAGPLAGRGGAPPPGEGRAATGAEEEEEEDGGGDADEGAQRIKVLYATQTGTAERFGQDLVEALKGKYGRAVRVGAQDVETYDASKLAGEGLALLVVATYGDGEPPDPAVDFFQALEDRAGAMEPGTAPLEPLRYGVFALGDREYEHFCGAGKQVDRLLGAMGARAVVERGEGDDSGDIEEDFSQWKENLFVALQKQQIVQSPAAAFNGLANGLANGHANGHAANGHPAPAAGVVEFEVEAHAGTMEGADSPWQVGGPGPYTAQHPFVAEVVARRELHTRDSPRSCIHAEISLAGSGMAYKTGDHVGVLASNPVELVDWALELLQVDGDQIVTLRQPKGKRGRPPPPKPVTLRGLLANYADLQSVPKKSALAALAAYAGDAADRERLLFLASSAGAREYKEWVVEAARSLLEVLTEFASVRPTIGGFFASVAPPLLPRFYSISSSPLEHPDTVHITCALVKGQSPTGRLHQGVASTWLANATPYSDTLPVFIRSSTFRLPRSVQSPVLMIGPGTGLAPFRGFLQERAALKNSGKALGPAHLFFGCRSSGEDFIYREELERYVAEGVLDELVTAFSREQAEKVYVQHRLLEKSAAVFSLIDSKEKGHIYVCGDAKHMAKDVGRALAAVLKQELGCSTSEAEQQLKRYQDEGRYSRDVW